VTRIAAVGGGRHAIRLGRVADRRDDLTERWRRGFEAWQEGTFEGAAEAAWHPDIVLYDIPELPDAGVHRGRQAALRRFAQYTEPLGRFRLELEELIEGPDAIMIEASMTGMSAGAAVPFEGQIFYVIRLEADSVIEMRMFTVRDAALEAAGIVEDEQGAGR
jgi:ketosteroid isomerase-like protein